MKLDKSTSSFIKTKTWKREVAVAVLVFLGYTAVTGPVELVEVLVYPSFMFAALAFGLDWKAKGDRYIAEQNRTEVLVG